MKHYSLLHKIPLREENTPGRMCPGSCRWVFGASSALAVLTVLLQTFLFGCRRFSRPGFLILSTVGILVQVWGAVLFTVGCLAASLVPVWWTLVTPLLPKLGQPAIVPRCHTVAPVSNQCSRAAVGRVSLQGVR